MSVRYLHVTNLKPKLSTTYHLSSLSRPTAFVLTSDDVFFSSYSQHKVSNETLNLGWVSQSLDVGTSRPVHYLVPKGANLDCFPSCSLHSFLPQTWLGNGLRWVTITQIESYPASLYHCMCTLLVWYGCNAYHVHYILPDALTLTHLLFRAGPFFAFAIFFDIRALDLFLAASTGGVFCDVLKHTICSPRPFFILPKVSCVCIDHLYYNTKTIVLMYPFIHNQYHRSVSKRVWKRWVGARQVLILQSKEQYLLCSSTTMQATPSIGS